MLLNIGFFFAGESYGTDITQTYSGAHRIKIYNGGYWGWKRNGTQSDTVYTRSQVAKFFFSSISVIFVRLSVLYLHAILAIRLIFLKYNFSDHFLFR